MTTRPAPTVDLNGQTLAVRGHVDAGNVVTLREQGEVLIAKAGGPLTVDLSALDSAHSVVLSMLLCWQRCAHQHQFSLVFQGFSDRLLSLAALSNLNGPLLGEQIPGFTSQS